MTIRHNDVNSYSCVKDDILLIAVVTASCNSTCQLKYATNTTFSLISE